MSQSDDRTFIRQVSGVIIGLMLVTVVIIFMARSLQTTPDADANPSQYLLTEKRVAPVSGVRVGEEGAVALAEAQAETTPAAVEDSAAVVDGEQVYNGLCKSCHDAGVAGAPIPGSDQLALRASEKGMGSLVASAINGINVMPPRGGNPALTDEQVRAAVEFMLQ